MYQSIIAALDFSQNRRKVMDAALRLANNDASKLHLVHVVQPISSGNDLSVYTKNFQAVEDEAVESATAKLAEFGEAETVPADQVYTKLGDTAGEIRKIVAAIGAEVIVIGSHGHSGKMRLLGATANKLLHGASCDVLTVHAADT